MSASLVLAYGDHPDQRVRCRPAQDAQRGIAVLVHGGYWRQRYTAELMEPLEEDLVRRGWTTVNIEYRRGPEAVWPTPLEDVRAACRVAADWAAAESLSGPLIGLGHSVGGQLALLAGDPLDGVVALAPVTDAARVHAEGLGDGAAREYFRADPEEAAETYALASPIQQLPTGRPTLLVHGSDDIRVPLAHSLDHLTASLQAGDAVSAQFPHQLSHLAAIDPTDPVWEGVLRWMALQPSQQN